MLSKTFLQNETANRLYTKLNVQNIPIIDYHCHLSPKEIYEDNEFQDIGQMWLQYDHYKWRLMRSYGVAEEYITGDKSYKEKFVKFAECIGLAAGNPLYHWTAMELSMFFDIDTPLNEDTAEDIYSRANEYIKENHLSPRKLIEMSNVEYIGTTDDILDSLEYHKLIKEDLSFTTKVAPSFRTDKLLLIRSHDYKLYVNNLSKAVGYEISDLDSFEKAVIQRLDYFCSMGCRFSDIGIESFPKFQPLRCDAESVFNLALKSERITDSEYKSFLFYVYMFLAKEYKKRDIVMQLHLAVKRNASSHLLNSVGADCGGDCVGDIINITDLIALFDAMEKENSLPRTILYTLNTAMYGAMATASQSFRNVKMGTSWWFNDHKRGIEEMIKLYAETSHIATFLGMLTDSRSFLSYARHDYFRQILCSVIGEWIEKGELNDDNNAEEIIRRICYKNINNLVND